MKNEIKKYFPKGKKGLNDISIITIILFIFLATSIIIPFVNAEFETTADTFDNDEFTQGINDDAENVSTFSAFTILITATKLALHDFGDTLGLPFWLDAIFSALGIVLLITIGRNIWVGGGA